MQIKSKEQRLTMGDLFSKAGAIPSEPVMQSGKTESAEAVVQPQTIGASGLQHACLYASEGRIWVVDLDLEKFFDVVNHHRLMWVLSRRIREITACLYI
jgi:hypothetical protein